MQCSDGQVQDELDSVRAEKARSGGRGWRGSSGTEWGSVRTTLRDKVGRMRSLGSCLLRDRMESRVQPKEERALRSAHSFWERGCDHHRTLASKPNPAV